MILTIILVITILIILFFATAFIGSIVDTFKEAKLHNKFIEEYYPIDKYDQEQREIAADVLRDFDDMYRKYLLGFASYFKGYPRTWLKKSEEIIIQRDYYKLLNINNKAFQIIIDLVKVTSTIEAQIEYFEDNILSAQSTLDKMNNEQKIKDYFPQLFQIRKNNLELFILHTEKIIDHLNEQVEKYNVAIDELSQIKKKSFISKTGIFTWNMLSAPVRNIVNLVEGIAFQDEAKAAKGMRMLILGAVGVGILNEAIDAFEFIDVGGSESINTALDGVEKPGTHFVEPHSRLLENGEVIWVDGDGDTTIDRSSEEGGGYIRSNPDGNPHNNINA